MSQTSDHEIELDTFEAVISGGVRRVNWHVERGGRWITVASYPGARMELANTPPGMVWQRRVVLCLPAGTRLMRVESLPGRRAAHDPLAYLWTAAPSSKRRVLRSFFSVGRSGRLLPATGHAG